MKCWPSLNLIGHKMWLISSLLSWSQSSHLWTCPAQTQSEVSDSKCIAVHVYLSAHVLLTSGTRMVTTASYFAEVSAPLIENMWTKVWRNLCSESSNWGDTNDKDMNNAHSLTLRRQRKGYILWLYLKRNMRSVHVLINASSTACVTIFKFNVLSK